MAPLSRVGDIRPSSSPKDRLSGVPVGMSRRVTFAMRALLAGEALVDGVAKILIVDGPPLREKSGEVTDWRLYVSPRTSKRLLTAVRSCGGPQGATVKAQTEMAARSTTTEDHGFSTILAPAVYSSPVPATTTASMWLTAACRPHSMRGAGRVRRPAPPRPRSDDGQRAFHPLAGHGRPASSSASLLSAPAPASRPAPPHPSAAGRDASRVTCVRRRAPAATPVDKAGEL
jgi:hypothetical protein